MKGKLTEPFVISDYRGEPVCLLATRHPQGSNSLFQRRMTHKKFLDTGSQPAGNAKGSKFTGQVMGLTAPLQCL